jgi:hypothetical protein
MEHTGKKRLHIAELRQKLQDDVNIILSDIADYILANDEESEDGEVKVHFDVDMVLRNMHVPRRVIRHSKRVLRSQAHGSLIPRSPTVESERPMPHYNPEFFKGRSVGNDKRPFGKLNDAARFVFKHI